MPNIGYRIIILMVFISLIHTACHIEDTRETYYSGKFGDFEWYFSNGEMVISKYRGIGGDVTVPAKIDGKPVNVIRDSAFSDCTGLISVSLPDGITYIGHGAFRDCDNLESVILPNGITVIDSNTFYGCVALNSINIPDSVTRIEDWVFSWCWGLESINVPNSVISIGDSAFSNSGLINITIPDSVMYIGKSAFSYSKLTNINIPDSVIYIGDRALSGCRNLDTINVSSGNTKFSSDDGILYNKDYNTLIVYPASREGSAIIQENVTDIYTYAFDSCYKLNSITIPDSVTYIGGRAFSGCSSLELINVNLGNTKYSSKDGMLFNKDFSALMVCPEGKTGKVAIPAGVIKIESSAFAGCIGLTNITIPEGVTSIEPGTFSSCIGLADFNIPDSVTLIGNGAFWRCYNLTNITIPENVTSIESNAFLVCNSLASVTFTSNRISPEFFSMYSFNGDLREKYLYKGIGTYIRFDAGYTWTKLE